MMRLQIAPIIKHSKRSRRVLASSSGVQQRLDADFPLTAGAPRQSGAAGRGLLIKNSQFSTHFLRETSV